MKKILLIIALSTLTTVAFAASTSNTPNYDMYAPKRGGYEVIAGLSVWNSTVTTNAGQETKGSGTGFNFSYAYGFADYLALHAGQKYYGYKSETGTTATDIKGLSRTTVGLKGLIGSNKPYFFYDAGYTFSLLEKRKDQSGEVNYFNTADTRDQLYGKLGFAVPLKSFTLGATYKVSMYQKTDVETANSTASYGTGNGSEWKVFAQIDFGTKIGLAYGESVVDEFEVSVSSIIATADKDERKIAQLYVIIPASSKVDILADVTKTNLKDEGDYSKYDDYLVSVGAKINF